MSQRPVIVVASDSFKGSLTSKEVNDCIAAAILQLKPECVVKAVEIADGGEGTSGVLTRALGGDSVSAVASDPLGREITAHYGVAGNVAIIDLAAASGLTLVGPEERNPLLTSTFGLGQLIHDALARGCRDFLIGIGGSATNDGGIGMLSALGYRFIDKDGNRVEGRGVDLCRINSVDDSHRLTELNDARITVACDVANPLIGPNGASVIFGPQKGANKAMVLALDNGLRRLAKVTADFIGKDFSTAPGAGAAGGVGFALMAYLGAELKPGVDMVLDAVGFDDLIEGASLVITGEGCLDGQTTMGKAPYGVLQRAKHHNVPVVAIGGRVETAAIPELFNAGFAAVYSTTSSATFNPSTDLLPAIARANLTRTISAILATDNLLNRNEI
ncbi:MAG: glycerate kinase [Muribaculaceae bacterium]|nr:glycerate kinase [Muribaculaceae bacterium]